MVAFFSTAVILIAGTAVVLETRIVSTACAQPPGHSARLRARKTRWQRMVTIVELSMLRILNEKNNDKALEFPVKAFSMLTEFEQLTLEEIAEMTEIDQEIMQPIVKKLLMQRIVRCKNCKLSINKNLNSIYKLIN